MMGSREPVLVLQEAVTVVVGLHETTVSALPVTVVTVRRQVVTTRGVMELMDVVSGTVAAVFGSLL